MEITYTTWLNFREGSISDLVETIKSKKDSIISIYPTSSDYRPLGLHIELYDLDSTGEHEEESILYRVVIKPMHEESTVLVLSGYSKVEEYIISSDSGNILGSSIYYPRIIEMLDQLQYENPDENYYIETNLVDIYARWYNELETVDKLILNPLPQGV